MARRSFPLFVLVALGMAIAFVSSLALSGPPVVMCFVALIVALGAGAALRQTKLRVPRRNASVLGWVFVAIAALTLWDLSEPLLVLVAWIAAGLLVGIAITRSPARDPLVE